MTDEQRDWNLLDLLEETSRYFNDKQIDNSRLQAEILLADVLQVRRLDLYLQFERQITPAELAAYRSHVRQRAQRVPVQYITGEVGFRHLLLAVSNCVLIPRPETEGLVEVALEYLETNAAPRVLDLGCGSGAIALALAQELPVAVVTATDVSRDAVRLTKSNAAANELAGRLAFACGDLFGGLKRRPERGFDAILSNPPYLKSDMIAGLEPEVREFEPRLALDGGLDGLNCYRRIVAEVAGFLTPAGFSILEVGGAEQAEEVVGLLPDGGMELAEVRSDLNGIPRIVVGRRRKGL